MKNLSNPRVLHKFLMALNRNDAIMATVYHQELLLRGVKPPFKFTLRSIEQRRTS